MAVWRSSLTMICCSLMKSWLASQLRADAHACGSWICGLLRIEIKQCRIYVEVCMQPNLLIPGTGAILACSKRHHVVRRSPAAGRTLAGHAM